MLGHRRDEASDTVLVENNGVTPEGGCNPFWNNSIVLNENSTASVIVALSHCMFIYI